MTVRGRSATGRCKPHRQMNKISSPQPSPKERECSNGKVGRRNDEQKTNKRRTMNEERTKNERREGGVKTSLRRRIEGDILK